MPDESQRADLTVAQVARELKIRRDAVVILMKKRILIGYDTSLPNARRPTYRITRADLDDYKKRRQVGEEEKPAVSTRPKRKFPQVREFF